MKSFWDKVKKSDGCWNWTGWMHEKGYGLFKANGKRWRAHRFVFVLFGNYIPSRLVILHQCDNRSCVRPSHLRIGTQKENMQDCAAKGRNRNKTTKLNFIEVMAIRKSYSNGMSLRQVACEFGISNTQVHRIVIGKCWPKDPPDSRLVK